MHERRTTTGACIGRGALKWFFLRSPPPSVGHPGHTVEEEGDAVQHFDDKPVLHHQTLKHGSGIRRTEGMAAISWRHGRHSRPQKRS
jgi:hypothetical protein